MEVCVCQEHELAAARLLHRRSVPSKACWGHAQAKNYKIGKSVIVCLMLFLGAQSECSQFLGECRIYLSKPAVCKEGSCTRLQCAISLQLLIRLQQAIQQPCASYGCDSGPSCCILAALAVPLETLQPLLHSSFAVHGVS